MYEYNDFPADVIVCACTRTCRYISFQSQMIFVQTAGKRDLSVNRCSIDVFVVVFFFSFNGRASYLQRPSTGRLETLIWSIALFCLDNDSHCCVPWCVDDIQRILVFYTLSIRFLYNIKLHLYTSYSAAAVSDLYVLYLIFEIIFF